MVTTCGSRLTGRIPIHIRARAVEYNKVNTLDLVVHCCGVTSETRILQYIEMSFRKSRSLNIHEARDVAVKSARGYDCLIRVRV